MIGTYYVHLQMPDMCMNNDPLHKVTMFKYLGIFINSAFRVYGWYRYKQCRKGMTKSGTGISGWDCYESKGIA